MNYIKRFFNWLFNRDGEEIKTVFTETVLPADIDIDCPNCKTILYRSNRETTHLEASAFTPYPNIPAPISSDALRCPICGSEELIRSFYSKVITREI